MLDYDKALEFAKLGYKAEDIKMLMEMDMSTQTQPTPPIVDSPLQPDSPQDGSSRLEEVEAEHKKELDEANNKIAELEKQIKSLQDAAVSRDISGQGKDTKSSDEVLADFARSFM